MYPCLKRLTCLKSHLQCRILNEKYTKYFCSTTCVGGHEAYIISICRIAVHKQNRVPTDRNIEVIGRLNKG